MQELVCIYNEEDEYYVYDKSDMTLDIVTAQDIVNYTLECGFIRGIILSAINGNPRVDSGKVSLYGWFRGSNYVVFLRKGVSIAEYYASDKKWLLCTSIIGSLGNKRVIVSAQIGTRIEYIYDKRLEIDKGMLYTSCFVPMKDALYVFVRGILVYKVCDIPYNYSTENYSTSRKMREVVLV